jgi:hypothetical protein
MLDNEFAKAYKVQRKFFPVQQKESSMFHRKIIAVMIVLSVFALAAWAQGPPVGQSPQPGKDLGQRKPSRHSGFPVVGEFERQPESDADEANRAKREQSYENTGTRLFTPYGDPGALADGGSESTVSTIVDYVMPPTTNPPGIPVSVVTAVVIGTVLGGNSFISKNHTAVYSDYQVRIDEILKQGPTATLAVGDEVVASRAGGAIHFPSGHRTNFLMHGHGLPEIGSQYVLFLWKTVPNQPVYEIGFDSGYQLKNGRVYALDEINERYYDSMSAPVFLDLVKKAIVASQTAQTKGAGQ